jgi:hypothetical protein
MTTKLFYYETIHFFLRLSSNHNALLQLLNSFAEKKLRTKLRIKNSKVDLRDVSTSRLLLVQKMFNDD